MYTQSKNQAQSKNNFFKEMETYILKTNWSSPNSPARKYAGLFSNNFNLAKGVFFGNMFKQLVKFINSNTQQPNVRIIEKKFKKALFQYELSFNTSSKLIESPMFVQLFHILNSFYNNFPTAVMTTYPYKMILSSDGLNSIAVINNRTQVLERIFDVYFTHLSQYLNRSNGDGIEYNSYGETPMFINSVKISLSPTQKVNGACLPKKLKLPITISASVVCPNNEDKYCMIYSIIISKLFLQEEKSYKGKANQFNKMEKFPEINNLFNTKKTQIEEIYQGDYTSEDSISKLEKLFDININIYTYINKDTNEIERYRMSPLINSTSNHICRLLFIPYSTMEKSKPNYNIDEYKVNSKNKEVFLKEFESETFFKNNNGHFCTLTKNCSLLNDNRNNTVKNKYYSCDFCDYPFSSLDLMKEHMEGCKILRQDLNDDERKTKFKPNKEDSKKIFNKYVALTKQPFIVYADTETNTESGHKLFSYRLYMKHSYDPKLDKHIERCAQNVSEIGDYLCDQFMQDITDLRVHYMRNVNLFPFMKDADKRRWVKTHPEPSACEWCLRPEPLMIHHDHNKSTDNIVAWVCNKCNQLEAENNKKFSIVFHNLAYDLLTIITSLGKKKFIIEGVERTIDNNYSLIAKTSMKYSTLKIERVKIGEEQVTYSDPKKIYTKHLILPDVNFIDSYAFVPMALATIINNMRKDVPKDNHKTLFPNTFNYIKAKYNSIHKELFEFSTQKSIIAYSHTTIESMNSKENLSISKYKNDIDIDHKWVNEKRSEQLEKYRSEKDSELEKDYERSNRIYSVLKKFFGEEMTYKKYFLFYLELDIFLLTDFFEYFRTTMISAYKLDPAHFIGLPSFSQQAMLFLTKKELHLIPNNLDLSQKISSNLRGGFSGIINKISTDLNKSLSSSLKKFISGIDINNLYGWAMSQMIANKFVKSIPPSKFKVLKLRHDEFAYFVEVTYTINPKYHDKLSKLPPLITKKTVTMNDLSEDQKKMKDNLKENYKSEKLCATLENCNKPILINYDNLLFYQRHGYEFTIHKCHIFEKEYIMKDYILYNTAFRQKAVNELQKDLYKLLNNIIYGKSLQRNDLLSENELLSTEKLVQKRCISPLLKSIDIIVEDELVFVSSHKKVAKYDTPIQCGFHILELSKLRIYTMLYDHIIPFCEANKVDFKILLTDTDSLYIEYDFEGSNFKDYNSYMAAISEKTKIFDMHSFSWGDKSRKKEVGLFLDEYGDSKQIMSLTGLCSKSYCYTIKNIGKDQVETEEQRKKRLETGDDSEFDTWRKGEIRTVVKGKGVRNCYLKALYDYEDYVNCANGIIKNEKVKFNAIMKTNFENLIVKIEKKTISGFDDKFFHYRDENNIIKSLPYGHFRIKDIKTKEEKEKDKSTEK